MVCLSFDGNHLVDYAIIANAAPTGKSKRKRGPAKLFQKNNL
jgi:hypothetical protein